MAYQMAYRKENASQVVVFIGVFADTLSAIAAVAQLDRVLGYEPRGRGFNSCQPHQIQTPEMKVSGVFVYL